MNPTDPKLEILAPRPSSPKTSLVKKWVIIANSTFVVVLVIMYILFKLIMAQGVGDPNDAEHAQKIVLLFNSFTIFGILTFLSLIVAVTLNSRYFTDMIHSSVPRVLIRFGLILVNLIVFFIFAMIVSTLLLWQ